MFMSYSIWFIYPKEHLVNCEILKHLHLLVNHSWAFDRKTVYTKQWALKQALSAFMLFQINEGKQKINDRVSCRCSAEIFRSDKSFPPRKLIHWSVYPYTTPFRLFSHLEPSKHFSVPNDAGRKTDPARSHTKWLFINGSSSVFRLVALY